ncbi:MAG: Asp-tRNA(Asn)/Glu-tRNA(Gln) amidotransferase subunit GatC [Candidatus Liberibacter ctenarytainae]|uniref:Aspartyl/glutamyl-tRNA(Asn/Gln) amidotransferase subunit C n=1 Tax=Candidatus Liberibacter ctenarytainae TaxID=2020335 RepID=A0A937AK75_9HYPH|nr:Asp-tRNA(Asn)/Glu-tRNA(Gln) amidotransferase subunit GatC [Candidatus Liberibacter ctenarytainae]
MSMNVKDVKRIASLSRIALDEEDVPYLLSRLNHTLSFLEQIAEVNVEGVEPMTSVVPVKMTTRTDVVCDGGKVELILSNAPKVGGNFFLVPKTVE